MHLTKIHRTFPKLKRITIRRYSQAAVDHNEYSETPEYPPILDQSIQGKKKRAREEIHGKIRDIKTIEEKQIALNMPRYYGFKCMMLNDNKIPYNTLPAIKYYTRSHFIDINKLPEIYAETEQVANEVVKEIKSQIEDAINVELECVDRSFNIENNVLEASEKEDAIASCIVRQINRIISNNLSDKLPHILSSQVDYNPRHEAFWFLGGVGVPPNVYKWRNKYSWLKKRANENIDRPIQYLGSPILAIRNRLPLKPILPYSEANNPEFKVPQFSVLPESVGFFTDHRHGTNLPGFWPGDFDEFGLISFHGRGHILKRRESFGVTDNLEALHCQAMLSSFGWLLAQANYQGFTSYNDITYPLATQTVITNGQLWSIYAYQLNTIEMHNEKAHENSKHNICFGTEPQKLYDTIEDGKVKGLNEDLLKMLVQLYINAPEDRDHELKPYLGKEEQVVADIEDDRKRCWLENTYKHIMSNRPKHNLLPEVYMWERIYKIEHQTRFFERKTRPFEYGINPFKRRLDEHLPRYIPRALRGNPKSKKKFETTYYPKV